MRIEARFENKKWSYEAEKKIDSSSSNDQLCTYLLSGNVSIYDKVSAQNMSFNLNNNSVQLVVIFSLEMSTSLAPIWFKSKLNKPSLTLGDRNSCQQHTAFIPI